MPTFVSKNGMWNPAKERTSYIDKDGVPQIYDGPDRAASEFIEQEGGTVGQDALKDPQLLQASRNAGFPTLEAYLEYFKPTAQEVEAVEKAQANTIAHKVTPAVEPVETGTLGGHYDGETTNELAAMEAKQSRRGRTRKA